MASCRSASCRNSPRLTLLLNASMFSAMSSISLRSYFAGNIVQFEQIPDSDANALFSTKSAIAASLQTITGKPSAT